MPEALSTLGAILTVFSVVKFVQQEDVDVYINDKKVAEHQPLTPQQKREQRRIEILNEAIARREQILLANNQAISKTHTR